MLKKISYILKVNYDGHIKYNFIIILVLRFYETKCYYTLIKVITALKKK